MIVFIAQLHIMTEGIMDDDLTALSRLAKSILFHTAMQEGTECILCPLNGMGHMWLS